MGSNIVQVLKTTISDTHLVRSIKEINDEDNCIYISINTHYILLYVWETCSTYRWTGCEELKKKEYELVYKNSTTFLKKKKNNKKIIC